MKLNDKSNAAIVLQKSLRAQFGEKDWFWNESSLNDINQTVIGLCTLGIRDVSNLITTKGPLKWKIRIEIQHLSSITMALINLIITFFYSVLKKMHRGK